jgi:aspartyl-tRNA synthetase
MERTYIKDSIEKIGKIVRLNGWASKIRDHGSLVFIDLRDWTGIVQLVINKEQNDKLFNTAKSIGMEYVLEIEGIVKEREDSLKNKNISSGNIEVEVKSLNVLNESLPSPFPLDNDGKKINENVRLKYRYIDIRRKKVRDLIENRHKLLAFTRNWFASRDFIEVQTPLLTVSSPEGARDYLVPSRIHKGKFYALPQAPQQYKQLLMVGGLDKYFQIAPCVRDEDPRADRHSGFFYQIDVECSFVNQEEFLDSVEPFFIDVVEKLTGKKLKHNKFPRISYEEAMNKYGTDKPDIRYDMFLTDLTEECKASDMKIFENVESVKAIFVEKTFSRKEIDEKEKEIRLQGAKGLSWFAVKDKVLEGPLVKFFNNNLQKDILKKLEENGYDIEKEGMIFIVGDEYKKACSLAGWLRSRMGDILELKDKNILGFSWIIDFPMFEWDEKNDKWDFGHNPFSMPRGGLDVLKNEDPAKIMSQQYDLACNGYELASGSIRNYHPETFIEAFKIVGYSEEETRSKFGHMISAFEYGAPPHGGFAPGFDRLMMLLFDEENIREVYAFPKTNAQELMTGAPREVDQKDLDILGIEIKKERK